MEMQVEQTTERMRIWGGQDIETEKTPRPKSPKGTPLPKSPKGLRATIYA